MIGCDMDWPPWWLLILFTLVMRNGESRETYPWETTSLNRNPRRIICYTLYSEPVWPKRRTTVRMFWFLNNFTNQKHFAQWALNTKVVQLRLLPVRFTFPTLRFVSLRGLFDYLPEPIKERSLLSRESQQRQPPLPMRFPPGFKDLRHRSLPHPDLRRYEATPWIPETTFLPMRVSLDHFFLQGFHLRDMIKLTSVFQWLWRWLRKEFLRTIWY
jgi:hypothetical protein